MRRHRDPLVQHAHAALRAAFAPLEIPPAGGPGDLRTLAEAEERLRRYIHAEHAIRNRFEDSITDMELGPRLSKIAMALRSLAIFGVERIQDIQTERIPLLTAQTNLKQFAVWSRGRVGFTNRTALIGGAPGDHCRSLRGAVRLLSAALHVFGLRAHLQAAGIRVSGMKSWALSPGDGTQPTDFRVALWPGLPREFAHLRQ